MAWLEPPELDGKRLARAEMTVDGLALAFADGTELTVAPAPAGRCVEVRPGAPAGSRVSVLPGGAAVRRARWIMHPEREQPWGLRLDLDDGSSAYVFVFDGALQVTDELSRAVRRELGHRPGWHDFRLGVGGWVFAGLLLALLLWIDLPYDVFRTWYYGTIIVGGLAVVLAATVAVGIYAFREQRARRRPRHEETAP